jgi:mono/diheme cytochrome c family protein
VRSLVPFLALMAFACDQAPPDLRVWRASDHDHTTNPGQDQVQGGPDAGTAPELAAHGLNEVTIVAWQQNCVRCHGRLGRGDGPQGVPIHATDFTNAAWQAAVNDEQLVKSIREGKGAMPPFPLPDATIRSLVQLVRLLGRASAPAPSASTVPGPAASGRAPGLASARALPPGHPTLPAGHPTLPPEPALPPGHPDLPPGHPPISSPTAPAPTPAASQ